MGWAGREPAPAAFRSGCLAEFFRGGLQEPALLLAQAVHPVLMNLGKESIEFFLHLPVLCFLFLFPFQLSLHFPAFEQAGALLNVGRVFQAGVAT